MLHASHASTSKTSWTFMDDEDVWHHFTTGDKAAFAYIYEQFSTELFNYGMKIKPHRSLVKDCIHDLFVDLWRQRNNLSATDNIKFYLFRALRRRIIYVISREKKIFHDTDDNLSEQVISFSIENTLVSREADDDLKRRISTALKKLSVRQREVIELIFFQQMSYEEAAAILAINVRSVYTLTWKAITAVKKHFSGLIMFYWILFLSMDPFNT